MTTETRAITISLNQKTGMFSSILNRFRGSKQTEIAGVRQLLSDEKAKLLHTIKTENPDSIYKLSKLLNRDFKAVRHDIKLLERFGIIELDSSHKAGRDRLKPIININQIVITINL